MALTSPPPITLDAATAAERAPLRFALACPSASLCQLVRASLAPYSLVHDPAAELVLVIDQPLGSAHQALAGPMPPGAQLVILTSNHSRLYWADLGRAQPAYLTAEWPAPATLAALLRRVAQGDPPALPALPPSPLTAAELQVVRLLAYGATNAQIAAALHMSEKTVRNLLSTIYLRLDVPHRHAALCAYWGLWQPALAAE